MIDENDEVASIKVASIMAAARDLPDDALDALAATLVTTLTTILRERSNEIARSAIYTELNGRPRKIVVADAAFLTLILLAGAAVLITVYVLIGAFVLTPHIHADGQTMIVSFVVAPIVAIVTLFTFALFPIYYGNK